jgi:hypothetical protein
VRPDGSLIDQDFSTPNLIIVERRWLAPGVAAITCRRELCYLDRRFIKAGEVGGIAAAWLSGRLEQSA